MVIPGIKNSKTVEEAKDFLINTYSLSEIQAKAILDLKLQKLASLEQEKIRTEHEELLVKIKEYHEILASEAKVLNLIKEELTEIKNNYGDERRSKIVAGEEDDDIDLEELIEEESELPVVELRLEKINQIIAIPIIHPIMFFIIYFLILF